MTEQVLGKLGKLDERSIGSIIWVTLEQAKLLSISFTCEASFIMPKKGVLNSKQHAKHPFAGQNKQHPFLC